MKIIIELTKKEKELYKKGKNYAALYRSWFVVGRLNVGGYLYVGSRFGYAFGVKFRKELYKKLKELEEWKT